MSDEKRLQLDRKLFIQGEIEVLTGLHIGGSSLGLAIGGADKVVIRNPITNLPYIPGSSLKGKMRSLLEKAHGLVEISEREDGQGKKIWVGSLCQKPQEDVVQLFGLAADQTNFSPDFAPTRLMVRDATLLNEQELANAENTDMYCTEIKTEVSIDRLTSAANPRQFERVPAGARFKLDLVLDLYNVDAKEARQERFVSLVNQALCLVEDDYIGGQGTRGYGQVKFKINSVMERTADDYRSGDLTGRTSAYEKEFVSFIPKPEA
nr:type III-A CRISPR-associated RAMP protein Csm3 [uncultured Desulfobulbus sp.]